MNRTTNLFLGTIAITAWLAPPTQAQSGLDWHTIDGGGGTSTGGNFEVSGTIGQPDASALNAIMSADGRYELTGGFWGVTLPACTSFVGPDLDRDCDVDMDDYGEFQACASGPAIPLTAGCEFVDLDNDGDGDADDFGVVQRCFSGPNNPADPDCTN